MKDQANLTATLRTNSMLLISSIEDESDSKENSYTSKNVRPPPVETGYDKRKSFGVNG
jgi:hypothetical protein